ncbi:hypothetical protein BDV95DRAFT_584450 [Massariosphaeria phaeospora]|uniref:Uncharacterized protein n=1 Tax=Massariosphaeria phaeospora TaxID=100035 RepID=A0A7C8M856_9PLEO|nr:hypothetical protein BDV95DRAFT_584450 [Massariosphaeria phaeospora]
MPNYPGFVPDPLASLAAEFTRLTIHQGWSSKNTKSQKKRRARFYADEWDAQFGHVKNKLQGWQELCEEVGIKPVPSSITQCRKALSRTHINLVNLMDHRRNANIKLIKFHSFKQFRSYTMDKFPERIFPKEEAKREGFIKDLLRTLT